MKTPFRILIVIDMGWPLKRHQDVYAGIEKVAYENEWDSTLLSVPEQIVPQRSEWPYDGIIGRISEGIAAQARKAKIPAVNVWMNSPASDLPSVYPDWHAAGEIAAAHLLSRGLSKFAYLGMRNDLSSKQQWAGMKSILKENGHSGSRQMVDAKFDQSQGRWDRFSVQMEQWMDRWTTPIGLCVMDDLLGRHLVGFCKHKKLKVPEDVAILCSQNEPLMCEHSSPTLSSIEMDFRTIGKTSAEILGKLMRGDRLEERDQCLPPKDLIMRRSTDVFAVADPIVAGALRFISDNCHKPIQVKDVVSHTAVSRRALERRFQDSYSCGIAREITRLRIERVKRQLKGRNTPIKSIAYANGFREASHLCKVFLQETGCSPAAWRKQNE